jgi:hypothetical protein
MYEVIDHHQFNKEKDLESCALKIRLMLTYLIVLWIYRSPSGNFSYFITQVEMVLNKLYKISSNIIVCGDFNVKFLDSSSKASPLKSLYYLFGLESTVNFPTRIMHSSQTLIDNIFLDKKNLNTITYPFINGISDHDGQIVTARCNHSSTKNTFYIHKRNKWLLYTEICRIFKLWNLGYNILKW